MITTKQLGVLFASVLSIIGLVLQFQTVTLLTGAGLLWVGAALAAGAVVAVFVVRARVVFKVVAVLVLVLCVANVAYVEHELNQKRHELQQIFP